MASTLLFVVACGGDDDNSPPDVSGSYALNVTNGSNDCLPLTGWQEGMSFSDISLELVQDEANVQGTFQGVIATLFFQTVIGASVFQGEVSGDSIEMTRLGTRAQTSGACTFTIRADLQATSNGDVLQGQITYSPITNDAPDCASIEKCHAVQLFNGARPPR